jgi:aconitate hydratase
VSAIIRDKNLVVCSVLSGNRNFEGRIQQDVRANTSHRRRSWSPTRSPAGSQRTSRRAARRGSGRKPVFLKDIWPTELEIQETMQRAVSAEMFKRSYSDVFTGR